MQCCLALVEPYTLKVFMCNNADSFAMVYLVCVLKNGRSCHASDLNFVTWWIERAFAPPGNWD